ncbi:paxillin-like protein 1 [Colletotrichum spaethianum]|uniref:Paxillin-like protein 1 n=1 Tax=Colletotrichum spaethianum TaxID=700344 RepID=A0AA37PBC8_9PEZI|nr:paxillin-like protein 1 [Colletotrichum spaethianum]GKT49108.1 paxillin-like protein 1 [Colletotrichum spaethianum]
MAFPRESSFMPTIKCSSCGRQVEISMMGEHICGGPGADAEPSPPPARPDSIGSYDQPPPLDSKYGRMPPPTLDTSAANLPYSRQGQLTPISTSTGSISISPKTPSSQALGRPDDYFQPQIANDYNSNQQPRRLGGYGGFDDGEDYGPDQMYPNEQKKQAPSLLQRMNTIAPGPFEMGKRPGARAAAKNAFGPTRQDSLTPEDNATNDRPLTSASNNSFMSSGSSNAGGIAPPRLPRKNGYGGFGPPGTTPDEFEPETFVSRAGTFPRSNEPVELPMRTPSAPGARPDRLRGEPNGAGEHERKVSMGPDTSRPPPPRTSLLRPMTAGRDGAPTLDLANEFGASNPYHTPSASTSSGASLFSHGRQASSQSSSQSSPANPRPRRNPSDVTHLMNDIESSMAAMRSPKDTVPPPPPQKPAAEPYSSRRAQPSADLRDDPAIQGGRPRARSPLAAPDYDVRDPMDRRNQHQRQPSDVQSVSSPPRNRPSRGNCKSCGDAIKGKSISSADGRLTGRYHKACFVCTTCREPFSSAEFYVHNDKPYCELHYHKLNGSLCGTCGRGIEGQYLEDEERVKYHVGCFRCGDCGMSLSNGYFEVNGKAYCERDAWRRMQPPPRMGNGTQRGRSPGGLGIPGGPGQGGRRPSNGQSSMRPPVGLPRGQRTAPGAGLAPPMPRMNKRNTRLGMM